MTIDARGNIHDPKGLFSGKQMNDAENVVLSQVSTAPPETQRRRRGHDFYPKDFSSWPATYATDGIPGPAKEVLAHYFAGGTDWYIVESDQDGYAFGYTKRFDYPTGEWGYIDLKELEALKLERNPLFIVERDIYETKGALMRHVADDFMHGLTPIEKLHPSQKEPTNEEDLFPRQLELRTQLAALGRCAGRFRDSIDFGHLNRGTAGEKGTQALTAWRLSVGYKAAEDEDYAEFKRGLEKATVHLYASKLDIGVVPAGGGELENACREAVRVAKTKRSSPDDRAEWMEALQHATSPAEYNGMMVAAAALSGTDTWWGFRDDIDKTVKFRPTASEES